MERPYLILCESNPQHKRFLARAIVELGVGNHPNPQGGEALLGDKVPFEFLSQVGRVGRCNEDHCNAVATLFRPLRTIEGGIFRIGAIMPLDKNSFLMKPGSTSIRITTPQGTQIAMSTPSDRFRSEVKKSLDAKSHGGVTCLYLWFDGVEGCYRLGNAYEVFAPRTY